MKTKKFPNGKAKSPKKKKIPDIITQLERSLDDIENGRAGDARNL